jgi:hypothetical protein
LPLSGKVFKEQIRPAHLANPIVPEPLSDLIHQCLAPKAPNRPERMSQVQGILDQLADEAASKLSDPATLDE